MKKADIYEVAVKILGLYLIIPFIVALREFITVYITFDLVVSIGYGEGAYAYYMMLSSAIGMAMLLLFAYFLIFKSKYLTKKICKPSDYEESASLFTDKKSVYEIALTLTGFLLIVWTICEFAIQLKNYLQAQDMTGISSPSHELPLIMSGIKIFLGVFIVMLASSIASFLAKEKKKDEE